MKLGKLGVWYFFDAMSSKEAVEYGLIDKVLTKSFS